MCLLQSLLFYSLHLTVPLREQTKYKQQAMRNFYGFRGNEVDPSDIDIVFQGGSTGNQRFTPEQFTIVGYLNNLLLEAIGNIFFPIPIVEDTNL